MSSDVPAGGWGIQGLELKESKFQVSPLVSPIMVPYLIPWISPLRNLDYNSCRMSELKLSLGLKQVPFGHCAELTYRFFFKWDRLGV